MCDVINDIIYYSLSLTNQSSVFGSRDQEQPIKGHYSGKYHFSATRVRDRARVWVRVWFRVRVRFKG